MTTDGSEDNSMSWIREYDMGDKIRNVLENVMFIIALNIEYTSIRLGNYLNNS